jgi:hypothetical protein
MNGRQIRRFLDTHDRLLLPLCHFTDECEYGPSNGVEVCWGENSTTEERQGREQCCDSNDAEHRRPRVLSSGAIL